MVSEGNGGEHRPEPEERLWFAGEATSDEYLEGVLEITNRMVSFLSAVEGWPAVTIPLGGIKSVSTRSVGSLAERGELLVETGHRLLSFELPSRESAHRAHEVLSALICGLEPPPGGEEPAGRGPHASPALAALDRRLGPTPSLPALALVGALLLLVAVGLAASAVPGAREALEDQIFLVLAASGAVSLAASWFLAYRARWSAGTRVLMRLTVIVGVVWILWAVGVIPTLWDFVTTGEVFGVKPDPCPEYWGLGCPPTATPHP